LLLKLYDTYSRGTISKGTLLGCLQTIESFVVRRAVCNVPTNQLKRIFLQAAKNFKAINSDTWLEAELASGVAGRRWPKDDEFKTEWVRYKAYSLPKRCKLLLEALEEHHGHKEPADLENATIEHVMPQELTKAWRVMLGANAGPIHEIYCDTIGNLTLTAYNSEMSNLPFEKKKPIYAESHYELNKWFAKRAVWGQSEIEKRALALWERAAEIWLGPSH
jgi:hypothetical protein